MRNIGFDEFVNLLIEDGLPEKHLSTIKQIFNEIPGTDRSFPPERGALASLSEQYSKTYQTLGDQREFIDGILNMPLFFTAE